jgi:hypothetical protein
MKERYLGDPVVGRDFAQGIVVEPFANILLDRGVLSLEPAHAPGEGSQIGDQHVVGIWAVLEERPLPGFDGVLRHGTSDPTRRWARFPE